MCVKKTKQPKGRLVLLTALSLASLGAQASVTISAGSANFVDFRQAGAISLHAPSGGLELWSRDPIVVQPFVIEPVVALHPPSASSAVNGSMSYTTGGSSGNFSEYDSSADGSTVALEMNRKGYGYRTEATAQAARLDARAETKWVQGSNGLNNGYRDGSSAASATATWSDWFVISGGTGLGTAGFASLLDGTMASSQYGSAGYHFSINYSTSSYCYWYNPCDEADRGQTLLSQGASLSGKGKSKLSQAIEGEFTFAYDRAFQLTATLNVSAANGGLADFMLASLDDSMLLPAGASVQSASGMFAQGLYVQAVPEAETYAMMLAGLGLVGFAATRRRAIPK